MPRRAAVFAAIAIFLVLACPGWSQIRTGVSDGSGASVGTGTVGGDPAAERANIKQRCNLHLTLAEKLLKEGNYPDGVSSLMMAHVLLADRDLANRWTALAQQYNQAGVGLLKEANDAFEAKNYDAAIKGYRRVGVAFDELPVGKEAREKLKSMANSPAVKAAVAEARADMMYRSAELLIAQNSRPTGSGPASRPASMPSSATRLTVEQMLTAVRNLGDPGILKVMDALENIVRSCPGAPAAEKAGDVLTELKADKELQARLAVLRKQEQARQSLASAEAYLSAGLTDKAREIYQQIVKDFPGTDFSDQASRQLGVIQAQAEAGK